MSNKKEIERLTKEVEQNKKVIHELKLTIQEMWEETHPPVMGGTK